MKHIENSRLKELIEEYRIFLSGLSNKKTFETGFLDGTSIKAFEFQSSDLNTLIANNAEFIECKFVSTCLDYMYLYTSHFVDCIVENSTFRNAEMIGSKFSNVTFKNCSFIKASMGDVRMENCNFTSCDFRGAKFYPILESTTFVGCIGLPATISNEIN